MRRAVMLVLVGVLLVGACGGEEGASETSAETEQVVIRTSLVVAATERAEPIATGEVLEGSTLGARRSASAEPSWTPTEAPIPRCG